MSKFPSNEFNAVYIIIFHPILSKQQLFEVREAKEEGLAQNLLLSFVVQLGL